MQADDGRVMSNVIVQALLDRLNTFWVSGRDEPSSGGRANQVAEDEAANAVVRLDLEPVAAVDLADDGDEIATFGKVATYLTTSSTRTR